ncbi:helix-turn-helix transcriptional regulator [Streptomyces sp. NBC_00306]|uniref:helix-turn-helix transcriptional regulator n=1 Tax=Streptomyces sp. NBC_00306 TaxID=2975708 RepID=UPI002E2852C0|nr:helix-turn-helix transcriptional regulator [Streptomyces sp. NBC_00306]
MRTDAAHERVPMAGLASAMVDAGMEAPSTAAAAAAALAATRRNGSVLICVDDAHLLDEQSSAVLLQLARKREAKLVVVTCEGQACNDTVLALWKEGWLARLAIPPLGEEEVAEVAESMLRQPLAPMTAARLAMLADGNLVALRELVSCALEEGTLKNTTGVWMDTDENFYSARLAELLHPVLQPLSSEERWGLEVLSVAHELPLGVATRIVGISTWEHLEDRGLVSVSDRSLEIWLSVSDKIASSVAVEELPVLRRRRILDLLIHALSAHPLARGAAFLNITDWRLELGERLPEAEILEACRRAWWAHDWRFASRLAESAWTQHGTPRAGLTLARIMTHRGLRTAAESLLEKVVEIGGPDDIAVALKSLGRMDLVRGTVPSRPKGEGPVVVTAEVSDGPDVDAAIADMMAGRPSESWKRAESILCSDDPTHVAMAGSAALVALLSMGRPLDCIELAPRLARAARTLGGEDVLDYDALNLAVLVSYARAVAGEVDEAQQELRSFIRDAADARNWALANRAGVFLARTLLDQGRVGEAYRLFAAACEDDLLIVRQVAAAGAVCAALHCGDEGLVETAAKRLPEPSDDGSCRVEVKLASAMLDMHRGHVDTAVRLLRKAGETALSEGAYGELADVIHALTRIDRAEDAAMFFGEWVDGVQGAIDKVRIRFAMAAANRDPDALAQCAAEFEENRAPLYAAEAWASASREYRRRREPRPASAASRRWAQVRSQYDGAPTHLLHMMDEVVPLSRREREVALQASAGHSNREIAEQLVISVRTVDNHLYRVYRKLGVTSRRALRHLIHERGL